MCETVSGKPSVLFVCVHNAGRSQMAAAFLTHQSAGRVEVRSAGSAPAETVNPAVSEATAEAGIDLSAEVPEVLTIEAVQASDLVITMGWGMPARSSRASGIGTGSSTDPAGQGVEAVCSIRDEIEARVRTLLADLLPVQ